MSCTRCVLFFFVVLLGGCVLSTTVTSDAIIEMVSSSEYDDGLILIEGDIYELVSMEVGLTAKGCRIFFKLDDGVCLKEWQKLDYDDKVSFFYFHTSAFVRGIWNHRRELERTTAMTEEDPRIPRAELREKLNSIISPQYALKCVASNYVHMDFCLLHYEPFASPTETREAATRWLHEDYVRTTAKAY